MPISRLVRPVTDCEPPAVGGPPVLPPAVAPRSRCVAPPLRPAYRPSVDDAGTRAAALFADAALRRVLEVIDRRRPLTQLRGLLAAGLVDSLPARASGTDPARLRRVVAQLAEPGGTAAEVAATFTRGTRLHAIACRIEQTDGPAGPRWQLVALHLG